MFFVKRHALDVEVSSLWRHNLFGGKTKTNLSIFLQTAFNLEDI